jgi:HSP20 family protein
MKNTSLATLFNTHRESFGLTPFDNLFDRLIEESFPQFGKDFGVTFTKASYPKVDIIDNPTEVIITAEIPGLKKEDVSVDLENDNIIISGKKKDVVDDKSSTYLLKELKHSSFKRAFVLGSNINKDKVTADYTDGILTITLCKVEPEKPKITKKKIL